MASEKGANLSFAFWASDPHVSAARDEGNSPASTQKIAVMGALPVFKALPWTSGMTEDIKCLYAFRGETKAGGEENFGGGRKEDEGGDDSVNPSHRRKCSHCTYNNESPYRRSGGLALCGPVRPGYQVLFSHD